MNEVQKLAEQAGFAHELVWDQARDWVEQNPDEPGYLRVIKLTRRKAQAAVPA